MEKQAVYILLHDWQIQMKPVDLSENQSNYGW
jgi:hypothetical protein